MPEQPRFHAGQRVRILHHEHLATRTAVIVSVDDENETAMVRVEIFDRDVVWPSPLPWEQLSP